MALCVVVMPAFLQAARITKVKGRNFIALEKNGTPWKIDEPVCAMREGREIGCGKVVKVKGLSALVQLQNLDDESNPVRSGDEANRTDLDILSTDHEKPKVATPSGQSSEVGIHGGLSLDHLTNIPASIGSGINLTSTGNRTSVIFGVDRKYRLSEFLSLEGEFNYVRRGTTINATVSGTSAVETINTDYLEVPLMLRGDFDLGVLRPFLLFGPSFASALNRSIAATDINNGQSVSQDASNAIRGFEVGLYAGGGVAFALGERISLNLSARYYYGLTDIDAGGSGIHHRGIVVLGGVTWKLGRPKFELAN